MAISLYFLSFFFLSALAQQITNDVADCTCGFYDEAADLLFTDSSIIYFNETDVVPSELVVESFEHRYDIGWNSMYRQGAAIDNVIIGNDTSAAGAPQSLGLYCNAADNKGLVVGASVRTERQDLFFGSFRSYMRAPRKWHDGSAVSMSLKHNITESWNIDVMNSDNASWAWTTMIYGGAFPDLWLGSNFTDLITDGIDPWLYTEYRVDWTRDFMSFYIGGALQKNYTTKINGTLPSTPAALHWQHWSLGNIYTTMGPPLHQAEANLGWTRMFFNSSTNTTEQLEAFDQRCSKATACLMSDNDLRGSTAYSVESTKKWKQHHPKWSPPWIPLTIDIVFAVIFLFLTTKTLWRRSSWGSMSKSLGKSSSSSKRSANSSISDMDSAAKGTGSYGDSDASSENGSRANSELPRVSSFTSFSPPPTYSGVHTPLPGYQSPAFQSTAANSRDDLTIESHPRTESLQSYSPPSFNSPFHAFANKDSSVPRSRGLSSSATVAQVLATANANSEKPASSKTETKEVSAAETTKKGADVTANGLIAPTGAPAQQRIDYLAGFISISAILVTFNHFGLTFWAAVIEPSVRPHYKSETWARKTIASYFLDPLWIGPFLMISTRFLVSNYLRTGKLDNMAQKIVARPFRLLTPVASIATLEYFLMDAGAIAYLEYLPSVTWSSWPFTSIWPNPGHFISAIIQLAYLIPNAAPMITYNYCTGVLWTIPVQLQGAWQTLLALIMIRECKTPWKRCCFYAFCVANHWYGLSWGSYYYAGIFLADMDVTYKYKKWLHTKPLVYYPALIFFICVALGGFTIDMVTQWTGVQYAQVEYGWHPYAETGLSISQSGVATYPDYFIPRLNALLTTVSMQIVVEICPSVQKVLSAKVFQLLFPHIFTVYLIHGFIFWSVGSWAMISIFSYGCPYWLCVLLTFIICYGTLLGSLPLLTPPIEMLGKNMTQSLWERASREPAPRKPTTFPFGVDLLNRDVAVGSGPTSVVVVDEKDQPSVDEKGKGKMSVTEKSIDM